MHATREEVESTLGFYAKFDSWVRQTLELHDRATAKAAAYSRAQEKVRKEQEAKAEKKPKTNAVQYVSSVSDWAGVDSFTYGGSRRWGRVRSCTLVLKGDWAVSVKKNALFPQLSVDLGRSVRPAVLTLIECRGWHVREMKQEGRVVQMEVAENTNR